MVLVEELEEEEEGGGEETKGRESEEERGLRTRRGEGGKEGRKESRAMRMTVVGLAARCLLSCRSCGGFLGTVEGRRGGQGGREEEVGAMVGREKKNRERNEEYENE
jgi:hypothetical protein